MTQKQTNEERNVDLPLDDDEIFEYLIAENAVMYMANN